MFEDIPVDVGVIYEGERIRWKETYMELGGPRVEHKFELARAKPLKEVEDNKITIIGPDIKDMKKKSYPFGIYVEVAGKEIEEDLEGVIERRIHEYCNFVEGLMHLNQRYDLHLRLSEKSVKKGFNSFNYLGKIIQRLYKNELPIIEKIQITFITDPEKVKEMHEEAMKVYEARDAKARGLEDEAVDAFYGCTLCQSFAPTHCCVITPQRYSNCGSISWFDGRAAARVDPKGPLFTIEKGECVDPFKGEWSGANDVIKERTLGEIARVQLYTSQHKPSQELYPHTSCGCFEAVAFYIPEVDGIGIVDRGFGEVTVNGLPFSTIADSTAGGRQVDGFHGVSIEYMRSPKFLQVEGGWNRLVWMPASIKERVKDFIPNEVVDKIATEEDVKTVEELKTFLESKEHPVVERWKVVSEVKEEVPAVPLGPIPTMPVSVGGFKIILKNARIHAERIIIKKEEK
jgi:acetyl-CoA decarbonylase/synthase complex subunit beta